MTVSHRVCPSLRFKALVVPSIVWFSCILCGLMLVGGCRLCADCDEDAYPSYGGAWQRTKRDSGRVGSIFDPGGSRASDLSERAKSDTPNETNRNGMSGAEENPEAPEDSTDQNSNGPDQNPNRDIMNTDGEDPVEQEREGELQDLEKRYRDLKLEEINHRRPQANADQWQ